MGSRPWCLPSALWIKETSEKARLGTQLGTSHVPLVAIQPFSCLAKAGGGVEAIGRTPKKNHPVKTNAMSLASENQCASETLSDTYLNEQAAHNTAFSNNSLTNPSEVMDLSWSAGCVALQLPDGGTFSLNKYCAIFIPLMSLLLGAMQTVLP